jgi:uncharacterized protein (DUF2126 family)
MTERDEFERAITAHDEALAAGGLEVWIGNEPTFTDRLSIAPEWVTAALGQDKRSRAERLLAAVAAERPGCAIIRSIGRQYPGEPAPRWSLGLYAHRDGGALWSGPADPLLVVGESAPASPDLGAFQACLESILASKGLRCAGFRGEDDWRLVLAAPAARIPDEPATDGRLSRPSIHEGPIAASGLTDELAADGLFLLILSVSGAPASPVGCVELPAFSEVGPFIDCLSAIAEAARACGWQSLVLRGFPPPVDASVCWTTVTPDPAVVEVNMAPHPGVAPFLRDNCAFYAAAARLGLEPYRLHYNGMVADSGGGGQITFGGPSSLRSPFFVQPQLLPRLIRYALRHPALSYLFAHDSIGPSGQSVRPDEHSLDALTELRLALALVARQPDLSPALLWTSLAPSLTDSVGNSHRAEINIEKLWGPNRTPSRPLGLVEFRAFRMQHTPERAAALAVLLRSILAMLMSHDADDEPAEWRAALHDRFALPLYLEQDLRAILADLAAAGWALAPVVQDELTALDLRIWGRAAFGEFVLTIRDGLNFWPLFGDATRQEGTSRLVDPSSRRIELALRLRPGAPIDRLDEIQLRAEGVALAAVTERDEQGPVRVFGVRYRSFVPMPGFHPALAAQTPLHLHVVDPESSDALEITLHEWRADGGAYDGLPRDLAEAEARRAERCATRLVPLRDLPPPRPAPRAAVSPWSLDLRFVPPLRSA